MTIASVRSYKQRATSISASGMAFLVDEYKKVSVLESLKTIYESIEHPWNHNMVYLETDPQDSVSPPEADPASASGEGDAEVRIVQESYTSTNLQVTTPKEKFLVLSYLHRPLWKAHIGETELPIYRDYGGFMCLKVPPGHYNVTFKYEPR